MIIKTIKNTRGSVVMYIMAILPLMLSIGALALQQQMDATVKTAQIQHNTTTNNQLVSIKNWLIKNSLDADNDGYAELLAGNAGNTLPTSCPIKSTDDYGHNIKYETWDLGIANTNPTYSQNNTVPPIPNMIGRITSAGADGVFGTSDDVVVIILNSDVQMFTNNSGWQENVINHTITQLNDNDQVAIGTPTPTAGASLTIYSAVSGVVASLGNAVNTIGSMALNTGGILKGFLNWNTNDTNTASGTAMMLQNLQGKLHLFDYTGTGISVSGGNVGINNTNPISKFDVSGGDIQVENGEGRFKGWYNNGTGLAAELGILGGQGYLLAYDRTAGAYAPFNIDSGSSSITLLTNGNIGINNLNPNQALDVNGNINSSGVIYPSNGTGGYLYGDGSGVHTSSNFLANGNIYWGAGGNWLSAYLNQALLTTSSPTFQEVYANGWFRNNSHGAGLFNQTDNQYWYSDGTYWNASYPNAYGGIVFRTGYGGATEGYVYYNSWGFGLLNNAGNWSYRSNGATTTIFGNGGNSTAHNYGAIQVQGTKNTYSGINFTDGVNNNGTLMMNTGYSGFYNAQDNNWRWYTDNSGNTINMGNLTVYGQIQTSASGIKFNDGTVQTTSATNWPSSLGTNGYAQMPNGLIMQWGTISGFAGTAQAVTFPIAFPNQCLQVQTTFDKTGNLGDGFVARPYAETTLGFTYTTDTFSGTSNPVINKFWMAIGY